MNLIYLYGPPGVGKYTVGKELAKLTGYKLFHNQLSIGMVGSVFPFGTEAFNRLVLKFRRELIEEAAKQNTSIIFTSAYARGYNDRIMKDIIRRVEKHKGKVYFVQLYCDEEVLLRRVRHIRRKGLSKIRSPKILAELLNRYNHLSSIPFRDSLFIDNTYMSPKAAAREIVVHYGLRTRK